MPSSAACNWCDGPAIAESETRSMLQKFRMDWRKIARSDRMCTTAIEQLLSVSSTTSNEPISYVKSTTPSTTKPSLAPALRALQQKKSVLETRLQRLQEEIKVQKSVQERIARHEMVRVDLTRRCNTLVASLHRQRCARVVQLCNGLELVGDSSQCHRLREKRPGKGRIVLSGSSSIQGLPLPNNGQWDNVPLDVLGSSLCYVALLVDAISVALHAPLPHALTSAGGSHGPAILPQFAQQMAHPLLPVAYHGPRDHFRRFNWLTLAMVHAAAKKGGDMYTTVNSRRPRSHSITAVGSDVSPRTDIPDLTATRTRTLSDYSPKNTTPSNTSFSKPVQLRSSEMSSTPSDTSSSQSDHIGESEARDYVANPVFRQSITLLQADVVTLCLQAGIAAQHLWPPQAILLNLAKLAQHCEVQAAEVMKMANETFVNEEPVLEHLKEFDNIPDEIHTGYEEMLRNEIHHVRQSLCSRFTCETMSPSEHTAHEERLETMRREAQEAEELFVQLPMESDGVEEDDWDIIDSLSDDDDDIPTGSSNFSTQIETPVVSPFQ